MLKSVRKFIAKLGPGLITGTADDDPSGIATYSQTGAQFGYSQLWLAPYLIPLLVAIQEMCGRIGLVTDRGLAGVIREHYPRSILSGAVLLLLIANTVNIGADLGAMAAAVQLVVPASFSLLLLLITAITLLLEVFTSYRTYAKFLKWLTLSLLSYVLVALIVHQDWAKVAVHTVIPTFRVDQPFMLNIVAILGTTISPYLFFWQSSEEVEEQVLAGKTRAMGVETPTSKRDIQAMRTDVKAGMLVSNAVMWFIILTLAGTLFAHGNHNISTATEAASALKPIAGPAAYILFALGIVGTGLLAVPVLAGAGAYALSEAFGWKEGLYRKFRQAHGFYGVITFSTLVGLAINFVGIDPVKALYYAAVLNGLIAPPLMLIIILISNDRRIMGRFTNSRSSNILGLLAFFVMASAGLALISTFFTQR